MTFLQLVNRVKQECGIAGAPLVTITGANNELTRIAAWVSTSWEDIQNSRSDWDFMRGSVSLNTTAGKQTYTVGTLLDIPLTDFKKWRNESFRMYRASAGVCDEIMLTHFASYTDFRDYYLLGSRRLVQTRPTSIVIAPHRSLILGDIPEDVYTVTGEYFKKSQVLTLDADVPSMPEDYHMMIVYKTMQRYGLYEVAEEQIQAGKEGYAQLYNRLDAEYAPGITGSSSLI